MESLASNVLVKGGGRRVGGGGEKKDRKLSGLQLPAQHLSQNKNAALISDSVAPA